MAFRPQPRLKNFIAFVPINAQTTRHYLRVYRRIHTPVVAKLFAWVMALSNRIIINQDKRVALAQTLPDSSGAHHDRLVGADCAISQFRRIHTQMLTKNTIEPTDLMKDDNTLL
ncbi:MAG: hypothetical protein O2966_08535 [Proteobacteria bacterium]|nr:hypothetical protein [Pseudomonadota bacterium]